MDLFGKQCPKCGLMQLPAFRCKICGTLMESLIRSPRLSKPSLPTQAPPIEPQGTYTLRGEEPTVQTEAMAPEEHVESAGPTHRLAFHGTGGGLFGVYIRNILLTIITLGIYYCWGKIKVRRYMIGHTEFLGDRFAFHGTGRELLNGCGKAFLIIFVLGLMGSFPELMKLGQGPQFVAQAVTSLVVFLFFIPLAMISSFRYRLTRSSWREIRFSFWGKAHEFMAVFGLGSILTGLTLGFYYPFFLTRKYAYMISHVHFGNHSFQFSGKGRDLLGAFLKALLLTIPTLGIGWFWFLARKQRYFWEHTSLGSTRFRSTVTGKGLLTLNLWNLLLLVLTIGIAWPWVKIRRTQFILDNLLVVGPLDLEGIQQDAQASTATGEGLAGFLNADFNLG